GRVHRVTVVSDVGGQISLWRVARPRLLPSPPDVLYGCDGRWFLLNATALVVGRLSFARWGLRRDSLVQSNPESGNATSACNLRAMSSQIPAICLRDACTLARDRMRQTNVQQQQQHS